LITELDIENFKAWEQIRGMGLGSLTGLFGTNSSGKSSIIQLLLLLKQTVESADRAQVLDFGDERSLTTLGGMRDVLYRHDVDRVLSFGLTWERAIALQVPDPQAKRRQVLFEDTTPRFEAHIGADPRGQPRVVDMSYELAGRRFTMRAQTGSPNKYKLDSTGEGFNLVRRPGRVWPLPSPVKFYGFPDEVKAHYQNAGFLPDLELAFESLFTETYYLGPLREYPKREYLWSGGQPTGVGDKGERAVSSLLAARGTPFSPGYRKKKVTLEAYTASWLERLGLISGFSVVQLAEGSNLYQVRVRRTPDAPEVLITDVGFGVSQVLPVIVLLFSVPEKSIIILEQPEIHLHPFVQAGLADLFIEAVKLRDVQIIFESHSEHLLQRLQRRIAEGAFEARDTALYFTSTSSRGASIDQLHLDVFGNIENWPNDFFGDPLGEGSAMLKAQLERSAE
jgi:predicted ATPase